MEPELIRKACGGDAQAFGQLIEMHYDFIHATAWKWTRSRADAEDVAQDVCVRLAGAIRSFRGEGRFRTWLYALVQIVDMKIWHSRWATRRRAASRIPEAVEGWLFGQMFAWFGIAYYALTDDARWFIGGMLLFLISFAIFPIQARHQDR